MRISLQSICSAFYSPFLPPFQSCAFLGLSPAMGSGLVGMYTFSHTDTVCPATHAVLEHRIHAAAAPTPLMGMGFQSIFLSQSGQDLWFSYFDSNQAENSWHSHNFNSIKTWPKYGKLFFWHNTLPRHESKEKYLHFFFFWAHWVVSCVVYVYLCSHMYIFFPNQSIQIWLICS